jgi:hypothetical protein
MEQDKSTARVKRALSLRELERERLKRTPTRELARQIRATEFFHWHCRQGYFEVVIDGRAAFRLTVKNVYRSDGNGRRADSLDHPRSESSIWARVERIRQSEGCK